MNASSAAAPRAPAERTAGGGRPFGNAIPAKANLKDEARGRTQASPRAGSRKDLPETAARTAPARNRAPPRAVRANARYARKARAKIPRPPRRSGRTASPAPLPPRKEALRDTPAGPRPSTTVSSVQDPQHVRRLWAAMGKGPVPAPRPGAPPFLAHLPAREAAALLPGQAPDVHPRLRGASSERIRGGCSVPRRVCPSRSNPGPSCDPRWCRSASARCRPGKPPVWAIDRREWPNSPSCGPLQ